MEPFQAALSFKVCEGKAGQGRWKLEDSAVDPPARCGHIHTHGRRSQQPELIVGTERLFLSEKFTYLERNVLLLLALVDRHLLENVGQPDSQAEALRAMRAAQGARVNAMQGWVRDRDRETTEENPPPPKKKEGVENLFYLRTEGPAC